MAAPLVYLGVNGNVFALDRATGEAVWCTHLVENTLAVDADEVNILIDGDLLIAATAGVAFGMDAATGTPRWRNELPKQGQGWISIAIINGPTKRQPQGSEPDFGN
jgi:outer membrane protein assembly factor BamB